MIRSILVVTTLLGMTAAASAQDVRVSLEPNDVEAHHARIDRPCAPLEGVALCGQSMGALRAKTRITEKQRVGHLTRFTRLAGMFMGRVDAADVGPLKVRFNLQLR